MTTKTISTWLKRINQTTDFFQPKLSQLSNHELILERDVVIKRLAQEIKAGGLICLAADYDVDGLSSSSILLECIRACGGRVQYVIASRFLGGYGFSQELADKVLAMKPALLVTCDFGSSNHKQIELMNSHGIDCLVIDHHLVPDEKLPSLGFLNPHRPECPSDPACKDMCSGGLALSVASGLLRELGLNKQIDAKQWLDLVALSTVSDVMPLTGDNRILTRAGLDVISKGTRPGIRALLELSKVEVGATITGRDIGFKLGPAINAPGRLGPPDVIIDLLTARDLPEARELAKQVKEIWDKRRLITDLITEACIKEIDSKGYANDSAIVVGEEHWGHGIVGISAARIVDIFKVPVAVIGSEGRGSLRGPSGSRLYDALTFSKCHLLKFGGHQSAAGCQVEWKNLDAFRKAFCQFFSENPPQPSEMSTASSDILELNPADRLMDVCQELSWLEPCGQGNPRPVLQATGTISTWKLVKGDHIKFSLKLPGGQELPCFKLKAEQPVNYSLGQRVVVQGDLRKNVWNGRATAEMFVTLLTGQ